MSKQLSIGLLQSRRDARIKDLAQLGPLLQGSLCTIRVTCGNPNCRCARGERHLAHQVTRKVRGTTKTLYIPVALVEEVRAWVSEYRRVKRRLREISALSEQIIRAQGPRRRARQRNLAVAASRDQTPRRQPPTR